VNRGEKISGCSNVYETVAQLHMTHMITRKWQSVRLFRCLRVQQKLSEDSGGYEITANFYDSDYQEANAMDAPEFALPLA
jgi:hypothetical protein